MSKPLETYPAVQAEILKICRKYGVTFSMSDQAVIFRGGSPVDRQTAKEEVDEFINRLSSRIREEEVE